MVEHLEIQIAPTDVPTDREAVIRSIRAPQAATPADTVRCGLALFNLTHPGELHAELHVFLRQRDTGEGVCTSRSFGWRNRFASRATVPISSPARRRRRGAEVVDSPTLRPSAFM